MKTEQINKVLSLSKRKKEINETLKIINNSENYELAFIHTGRNAMKTKCGFNDNIEDLLDEHHLMIIRELEDELKEIDKQIEDLYIFTME
jgi:hypothetical protein